MILPAPVGAAAPRGGRSPARVELAAVAAALPERVRSSEEIEALLAARNPGLRLRPGTLRQRTGIVERRVARDDQQCSDLAADAAREALARAGLRPRQVDLLIFAAAGQDLIEPATAHIVQHKLGTRCPVFDVKNACNSFLNGIQLGESLIRTGSARNALVVTGEICSRAVRWEVGDAEGFRRHFPGYTMGDGGAAAVLAPAREGRGILYRGFASRSRHWGLATFPGGGSMHPRGEEWAYFHADGPALKDAFVVDGPPLLAGLLEEAGANFQEADRIVVHQVGVPYHETFLATSGIPPEKVEGTVARLGNLASASIPVAHALAVEEGRIRPGHRVMWVGMGSGISVGLLVLDT